MSESSSPPPEQPSLWELALVFLRLGIIAFGGPAAHIALIEEEVVQRRQWLSREKLLDLLGITHLLPGPNSTELAIHIGYERAGLRGLVVAGVCFIAPAMAVVWLLAAAYTRSQALPQLAWLLYGIKPMIIAIVVRALWKLGRTAIQDWVTAIAAIAVIIAFFLNVNEILLLILAGLGVMLSQTWRSTPPNQRFGLWLLPFTPVVAQTPASETITGPGVLAVFWFFLKVGAVLYGSGYVLLAFVQRGLVEQYQWLTTQQVLDAVAIGQLTPGPILTTATFIGYLVAGNGGAIAATVGIFLPAFLLVALVNPWIPKLRRSPWASAFLRGVNAASLGLMAVVTLTLAQTSLIDWLTIALAILGAIAVFKLKLNSAWLILISGVIGYLVHFFNLI